VNSHVEERIEGESSIDLILLKLGQITSNLSTSPQVAPTNLKLQVVVVVGEEITNDTVVELLWDENFKSITKSVLLLENGSQSVLWEDDLLSKDLNQLSHMGHNADAIHSPGIILDLTIVLHFQIQLRLNHSHYHENSES
jgi:hypothetical protein